MLQRNQPLSLLTVSDLASEVTALKAVAAKATEELSAEKNAHAKTKAELAQALGTVDLVQKTSVMAKSAFDAELAKAKADLAKAQADLKALQKKYASLLKKKK